MLHGDSEGWKAKAGRLEGWKAKAGRLREVLISLLTAFCAI